MDDIVLDVEIQKTPGQGGLTWEDTDKLGVACCVLYEARSGRWLVYGPGDLKALRQRVLAAGRVTTFNGWKFDLPVIWGKSKTDWPPAELSGEDILARPPVAAGVLLSRQNDLLRRIWQALGLDPDVFDYGTHGGWGLDAVCRGTLGEAKSGRGELAPGWFQQGNWARLLTYCLHDVQLTRDLAAFVDRYGFARNADGRVVELGRVGRPSPQAAER